MKDIFFRYSAISAYITKKIVRQILYFYKWQIKIWTELNWIYRYRIDIAILGSRYYRIDIAILRSRYFCFRYSNMNTLISILIVKMQVSTINCLKFISIPTHWSVGRSTVGWSVGRSVGQLVIWAVGRSINWTVRWSFERSVGRSVGQLDGRLGSYSVSPSVSQSFGWSVVRSVGQLISASVGRSVELAIGVQ